MTGERDVPELPVVSLRLVSSNDEPRAAEVCNKPFTLAVAYWAAAGASVGFATWWLAQVVRWWW